GKIKKLQKEGLGETDQSATLMIDEIFQILDHESMSGNDNESLVRHVFFWLSLLCSLQSSNTAKLKVNDISRQPHRHRSHKGIKAYNNSNEDQKIQNTALLISLDYEDLPYEEFNYFSSNDSIFMTAAENYTFDNGPEPYNEYSDSSNSSPILPPARSNYDKRSTFRS
ncbi:20159_t:CDS:2, partial [Cetraspora pellucida]